MFESFRLSNLPSYAKLFVGLFALLMLCVCFWAGWLYTVENGGIGEVRLPNSNVTNITKSVDTITTPVTPMNPDSVVKGVEEYVADSEAVLAPIWDSTHKGRELKVDSAQMTKEMQTRGGTVQQNPQRRFSRNLKLAHTHVNGQTLLFFAIGLIFLFTSVKPSFKKIIYVLFFLAIIAHNIGLTGMRYASVYDDILAISGVAILVIIVYMVFMIFIDLAKKPAVENR
jgi:hypothetical protein